MKVDRERVEGLGVLAVILIGIGMMVFGPNMYVGFGGGIVTFIGMMLGGVMYHRYPK